MRYAPSLSGGGVSEESVLIQTENARPVHIPLTGIEGDRPDVFSISQARALGAGEEVTIQGILTTGSGFYAGKRFIQDATGALVLTATSLELAAYDAGDNIEVKGILSEQDNLLELGGDINITMLQENAGIPAARNITSADQLDERNEAELLVVNDIRFMEKGYFEQGRSYTIYFDNGAEAFLRIGGDAHSLAGTLIPERASVTAVLAQREAVYELLPRSKADLEVSSLPKAIVINAPENGLDLGITAAGTSGSTMQYSITGLSLTENIAVSVAAPFELSLNGSSWSQSLSVDKQSAKKSIYVRFSPANANGDLYVAEVLHEADGLENHLLLQAREGSVTTEAVGPEFEELFDQCLDLNSFTRYDADGSVQWQCAEGWGTNQSGAVGIYLQGEKAEKNEDWLISPRLLMEKGSRLGMEVARQFEGPELELLVSTDYNGVGLPGNASWEKLPVSFPAAGAGLSGFEDMDPLDLSQYAGQEVYLAFRYTSTYESAAAYLIDNFRLTILPMIGFAEQGIRIQEGGTGQLTLSLGSPAIQNSHIILSLTEGSGLAYGEQADYVTNPASSNGNIRVEVAKGQEEMMLNITALEDFLEESDEELSIKLAEVGPGLLMDEGRMGTTVIIQSNNAVSIPIAEARAVSDQGLLLNLNQLVKLKGVAYGPDLAIATDALEFRLVDHSAESMGGITIYLANASGFPYALKTGDELEITGIIRNKEGLAVLEPQQVQVLSQEVALLEPKEVSTLDENTESRLLMLEEVEVVSGWQNNPSGAFMVTVKNAEGHEYQVQIRPSTDLYKTEKPSRRLSIVGFGVQQDPSAPYTAGYYLLPRSQADFKLTTGLDRQLEHPDLSLYPNPTSGALHIRSSESQRFERISIMSLSGQRLMSRKFEENKPLDLSILPAGIYLLKIQLKGGKHAIERISVLK